MAFLPFGAGTYYLNASISSTATTITLSSFAEPVTGTLYTMALLGTDTVYATIAPKTTSSEFISFTGITQNADGTATLTGVTRGLAKKTPFTTSSSYKLPHPGQSVFIISDPPQLFNEYVTLDNAETIVGKKTFPGGGNASAPVSGTVYAAPTADLEYASKKYVDDIAVSGAADASTTVKGIVELATQAELDAGTSTGGTGAKLVPTPDIIRSKKLSDMVVATGPVNNYSIAPSPAITAYSAGQTFFFQANSANTGASYLNVNGVGSMGLVKRYNTTLSSGDILAGQTLMVQYDGTNFVLISNPNPVDITSTQTISGAKTVTTPISGMLNYQAFTASGTWTKPSNLVGTEIALIHMWGGGGGGAGGSSNAGGGGGGGAFVEVKVLVSTLSATLAVIVGTGGNGGTGAAAGSVGISSSFASFVAYAGGGGGPSSSGGGGGGGGGGNIAVGGTASNDSSAAGGGINGGIIGGTGGTSAFGGGGGGGTTSDDGAASTYGGGGGGAGDNAGGGAPGGRSLYGGGGGGGGSASGAGGAAGASTYYGGVGGAGGSAGAGNAGTAPGGGGGGGATNGAAGARGEVRVWVIAGI